MQKILAIPTDSAMQSLGEQVALLSTEQLIVYLSGGLGAGKTTWVRGFLRALGYTGKVKSPTYTLVEPYQFDSDVYHFDLYRLEHEEELKFLGMEDYFGSNSKTLIEWPEKFRDVLPKPDLDCQIDFSAEGRLITLCANTPVGEQILLQL